MTLIVNQVVVNSTDKLERQFVAALKLRDRAAKRMFKYQTVANADTYDMYDQLTRSLGKQIFGKTWGTIGDKHNQTAWRNISSNNVKYVAKKPQLPTKRLEAIREW